MTQNMQDDCMTWNYRTAPPAYVQQEIDDMARPASGHMEPEKMPHKSRKPGIGMKKDYGYKVPDVMNGKPSGEADGSVKEAMFGWRDHHVEPEGPNHRVTFYDDERPSSGSNAKFNENMFDLLAHTGLAENNPTKAGAVNKHDQNAPSGPKFPKDPRKNLAYVNRANAISEKYNKVEHKPWKMPKFENVPPMVSSIRSNKDSKMQNSYENPLNDPAYPGLDGKPISRQSPAFVNSRMEESPPIGSRENLAPQIPISHDKDAVMFDV